GHSLSGSRDESSLTPLLSLQYKLSDNIMFYGSAVTGFKSGGFDARANNTSSFEFEEEEATSYEFGVKTSLLDNTLELNAAYYKTDYDNLQVSQFDGVLGFTVGNAKKTEVQGIEIDGRWLISEGLTMNYSLGYLDHEFKDFDNGNCYSFQAVLDPDSYNAETGLCDYTGKSGQYTPEFTANVGFQYAKQVSLGIFDYFTSNLGFYHSSSQNVDVNLNPLFEIDSYTKVDLRIALEGEHFNFAIFGKNITNEKILTYVGNVPLSINSFGTNTFYGFVDRPASYGVQIAYEF
ncbi:MAG: TonB-dependent receptor domain-containing protein, partial [Kangiellaceae bacterium]